MSRKRVLQLMPVSAGMALTSSSFLILGEIFIASKDILQVLLAVIIGGILCFVIAIAASNLSRRYPGSSGLRTWTLRTLGDRVSLFVVYILLCVVVIFSGVEMLMVSKMINLVNPDIPKLLVPVIIVLGILAANLASLNSAKIIQIMLVYTLISTIFLVGMYGIVINIESINQVLVIPDNFNYLPFIVGTSIFLFIGFEWVCTQGDTRQDYEYAIPRTMKYSIILLGCMYILFLLMSKLVLVGTDNTYSGIIHLDVGMQLFGLGGVYVMISFSILAMVTTFNAGLLSVSRLIYALSREGKLPVFLSKASRQNGVPYMSLITICFLSLMLSAIEFYFDAMLSALIVCSSLYSFVYAMILVSEVKSGAQDKLGKMSKVKTSMYIICVITVFIIGVFTLFSMPVETKNIFILFTASILISFLLTREYSRPDRKIVILNRVI